MQKMIFSALICSLLMFLSSLNAVRLETIDSSEKLARNIHIFGADLLNGLSRDASSKENILVSPVNVYYALALVHLGAGEKTRAELDAILKLSEIKNYTAVHQGLKDQLSNLFQEGGDDNYHEIALANGIFLQNGYPIKDSYLRATKKFYNTEAKNLDFSSHSQEATDVINEWISKSTKGRISKFYDSPVSVDTIAVLVCSLYSNTRWRNEFQEENTKKEKFDTGFADIQIPMMNLKSDELYYEHDDTLHYDSLSIPYSGHECAMVIYLQHQQHRNDSTLHQLFHKLVEKNKIFSNNAQRELVHLKLPKMKFGWKKSVVKALNLSTIFKYANLSEMTPREANIEVSDMIHATELEVDEKGTIATAATAVEILSRSFVDPPEPIPFHVDRPFLMTIVHEPSHTILFVGVIRDPTTHN